jgi:hypothetical protein
MLVLVLAIGAAGFGASPRGAGGPRGASPHRRRWPRALDTGAFTTPRERMIYTRQARRPKDRPYAQRRHPGIERSYGLTWDKHQTCRGRGLSRDRCPVTGNMSFDTWETTCPWPHRSPVCHGHHVVSREGDRGVLKRVGSDQSPAQLAPWCASQCRPRSTIPWSRGFHSASGRSCNRWSGLWRQFGLVCPRKTCC